MTLGITTLVTLVLAATFEVGGDAAIRHGLARSGWPAMLAGAILLVAYGFVVNTNRTIDFGRLMGLYIVTFFVVSQVSSVVVFGERPSLGLLVGGALIVAGGLVIQASPQP